MLNRQEALESLDALRAVFGALTIESCSANASTLKMTAQVMIIEDKEANYWDIGMRVSQYRTELEKILSWVKPLEDKFLGRRIKENA